MKLEGLRERAERVERATYFPEGKDRDFSPYSAREKGIELMNVALESGAINEETLRKMSIKSGGRLNEFCGNHWLWNTLMLLGVKTRE